MAQQLVDRKCCLAFIKECFDSKTAVLGIEGFSKTRSGGHRAEISDIADFSGLLTLPFDEFLVRSHDEAIGFLHESLGAERCDLYSFELVREEDGSAQG